MNRQKPLKLCDKAHYGGDIRRNDGDRIGWRTKYNGKCFQRVVKSVMQFDTFRSFESLVRYTVFRFAIKSFGSTYLLRYYITVKLERRWGIMRLNF